MKTLTDRGILWRIFPVMPRKRVKFDPEVPAEFTLFESKEPVFKCLGGYFTHSSYNLLDWFVSRWDVFLYVTLENYIYETWMRLYCTLTKKTKGEMLTKLRDSSITPKDIQNEIEQILAPYNCLIQVEYFPSNTISPGNIAALIQKYNRHPYQRVVKAAYVDYLDLLQPDEKAEMYRLDLGTITSRLKIISASFEIPLITATQLNREAYRKEKEKEFGMETVSESIQKVFIADFGAVIQRAESPENGSNGDQPPKPVKAILKVEKNRDGKTGKTNLYFDYPRFRILTNEEYMNEFGEVMKI